MKRTSHARTAVGNGRRAVPVVLVILGLSALWLGGCGDGGLSPEAVDYGSFTENPADHGGDRGALSGRVVDPAGQPVAGAVVTLSGARRQAGPASFTTHTKNDGRFAIGNVLAATYQLLITRRGARPLVQPVKIPGGVLVNLPDQVLPPSGVTTSGSVDLNADRYTGVEATGTVTVTDTDLNLKGDTAERTPVQIASVSTDPVGETVTLTETGPDTGVFTGTFGFERPFNSVQATPITPGNGKVGVYAEATVTREEIRVTYHDAANAQGQAVDVSDTATYEEPPSTLSGVIRAAGTDQPVAGAWVALFDERNRLVGEAVSRSDGSYAFYGVPDGVYSLVARRDGFTVQTQAGIVIGSGQPAPLQTDGRVAFGEDVYTGVVTPGQVTVWDDDQNRNLQARDTVDVVVRSAATDPPGETLTLTETGPNTGVFTGTFGFERPFNSTQETPITPGNGQVGVYAEATVTQEEIRAAYHDATNAQGQAAHRTDTAIYQEPYSTLSGVVQSGGQPVDGAAVLLFDAQNQQVGEAVSRPDGSYAFYDVPDGVYSLTAVRAGFQIMTQSGIQIRRPGT